MRCVVMSILLALFISGCVPAKPRRPRKTDDNAPVASATAASVHRELAAKRAELYEDLAKAVEDGDVKTVNDCATFFNPRVGEQTTWYTAEINKLRQSRLHDADDTLPSDAADVFRQLAKEYREAAK